MYMQSPTIHPPSVINEITKTIGKRLSDLSFDEQKFEKSKGPYEEALARREDPSELKFRPPAQRKSETNTAM
jgi:hypothetical protein